MSKPDGGPAFPSVEIDSNGQRREWFGLSLRDYFAAKAMQGALSCFGFSGDKEQFDKTAKLSYEQADAMLAAREVSS